MLVTTLHDGEVQALGPMCLPAFTAGMAESLFGVKLVPEHFADDQSADDEPADDEAPELPPAAEIPAEVPAETVPLGRSSRTSSGRGTDAGRGEPGDIAAIRRARAAGEVAE